MTSSIKLNETNQVIFISTSSKWCGQFFFFAKKDLDCTNFDSL